MYIVDLIFKGINAAVPLLVLVGVNSLAKSLPKTSINIIIVIITILLTVFLNISPVYIILAAAIYGIVINRKEAEK